MPTMADRLEAQQIKAENEAPELLDESELEELMNSESDGVDSETDMPGDSETDPFEGLELGK
jgi:hypothetical protein